MILKKPKNSSQAVSNLLTINQHLRNREAGKKSGRWKLEREGNHCACLVSCPEVATRGPLTTRKVVFWDETAPDSEVESPGGLHFNWMCCVQVAEPGTHHLKIVTSTVTACRLGSLLFMPPSGLRRMALSSPGTVQVGHVIGGGVVLDN